MKVVVTFAIFQNMRTTDFFFAGWQVPAQNQEEEKNGTNTCPQDVCTGLHTFTFENKGAPSSFLSTNLSMVS